MGFPVGSTFALRRFIVTEREQLPDDADSGLFSLHDSSLANSGVDQMHDGFQLPSLLVDLPLQL